MSQFRLNLATGSVIFPFTLEAALKLKAQINELMQTLKLIANQNKSDRRHQPMEYRHTGETFVEIFCNPNIYAGPFAAKVLVTVRDDKIRMTSEADLTRLVEDLEEYLAQNN